MEMHTNDRLNASEGPSQKKSRVTRLSFLLPRVGLVLLACCITMLTVVQSTYGRTDAVAKNKGTVKLNGDGSSLQATLDSLVLSGLPKNANLIIHIHAKNTTSTAVADQCKGPVLFVIKDVVTSDAQGKVDVAQATDFTLQSPAPDPSLLKASDLSTWFLNVHNAAVIGADGKPASVACGPLSAKGVATLKLAAQKKAGNQNQGNNQANNQGKKKGKNNNNNNNNNNDNNNNNNNNN